MKSNDNYTTKEHYVPQFYLKYFAGSDGKISCIFVKDKKYCRVAPKTICCEKNIYETMDDNGHTYARNYLENYFSQVEGHMAILFNNIIERCHDAKNQEALILSSGEKEDIANYLSIQYLRHPIAKNEHNNMIEEFLGKPLNKLEKNIMYTQNDFLSDSSGSEPIFKINGKNMIESESFSFFMPKDNTKHFFTSDFPVWADITQSKTDIRSYYFPLSPNIAICMRDRKAVPINWKNNIVKIDDKHVDQINAFTIRCAPQIILGKDFSTGEKKFICNRLS